VNKGLSIIKMKKTVYILFILTSFNSYSQTFDSSITKDKKFIDILYAHSKKDTSIIGSWLLVQMSSNWGIENADFEYLHIRNHGNFDITKDDIIILSGKLEILDIENMLVEFTFDDKFFEENRDDELPKLFSDSEKYFRLVTSSKLKLIAPCCDRINYYFIRKEE